MNKNNKPVHFSGPAHLCFLPNGRFTSHVKGNESTFSIVGGADYCLGAHECAADHKCCYDDACKFHDLTVFDHSGFGESTLVPRVLHSGGEKCTLSSTNVRFVTEQLLKDGAAEECIEQLFPPELKGRGCYICIGHMKISFPEPLEEGEQLKEERPKEGECLVEGNTQ